MLTPDITVNLKKMKVKIVKTILPTIIGIVSVIGLLFIFNLIFNNGSVLYSPDNGFFGFIVPFATICALIIQFILTLPFWEKFKSRRKVFGMNIIQFVTLISIVAGLIFGFVFWERSYGINELILVTLTGVIAFGIYWTSNILTLKRIDRV